MTLNDDGVRISIRLPAKMREDAERAASAAAMPLATYIRTALREKLDADAAKCENTPATIDPDTEAVVKKMIQDEIQRVISDAFTRR